MFNFVPILTTVNAKTLSPQKLDHVRKLFLLNLD